MEYIRQYFRRPTRLFDASPSQFLIRAIDDFGVAKIDDAGFKRLVEQVMREYSRSELLETINRLEIRSTIKPNASHKTLARIVTMIVLRWSLREMGGTTADEDFSPFGWRTEN